MPTLQVPYDSPLHKTLCKKISARIRMAEQEHQKRFDKWRDAENRMLAFIPEQEADALRRHKREVGGEPKYTTIQIPYTYSVLMSAHTYWTSVFFARSPIHQFTGRHGEGEMQIQAMEALIGYQVEVGAYLGPYYIWLYDAAKYGYGAIGSYWDKQKLHYGQLVEMPDPLDPTKTALFQTTTEVPGYQGNCVYNISPWDFITDPRVPIKHFQKGEFVIVRKRMSWNEIVRRQDTYYNKNTSQLKDHVSTDKTTANASDQLQRPWFTRMLYEDETETVGHPAGVVAYEFYVDLIPKEWGVGTTAYPQKWCFTITEDLELIFGATPISYVHCQFPFDVLEPEVEGYGMFTRGMPEILDPIQNTIDWLVNTHFYNVRASMNNQFIVDPSKLVVKDVANSGPGFIWRLRPEAYGSDISKMFMQVAVQDMTRGHMADVPTMFGMGERISGVNDQIMGTLNTGGTRKTATEVRTTTGFGVNRQKTICEYMSGTTFSPHAQKLVQNSQQMYDVQAKMRRVGSFALDAGQQFLNVSPEDIVGFYDLVPVDGTMPIDRMAQANLWKEIMGSLRMMPPQVVMGYDWARVFAWVAQLGGLKNINQFKLQTQVVPDEQLAQQVQQGNVVPMPQRPGLPSPTPVSPGNSSSTQSGLDALGGESGGPGY